MRHFLTISTYAQILKIQTNLKIFDTTLLLVLKGPLSTNTNNFKQWLNLTMKMDLVILFARLSTIWIFSQMNDTLVANTTINFCYMPQLPTKPLNQVASFIVFIIAMYSTSTIDIAIVNYKITFQLIILTYKVNTYPIKDLILFKSPA